MKIYYNQRLKDLREDMDLKQEDIAKIINTSQSYYAQYENGKRSIPFERIIKLADFYNVSIDYIAGRTNNKKGGIK
ncbi:MAG: helix-turn-helix transcriptional regulator [Oscillospiraceae bacterium]|nr:helix-turn-helix transcriptional regulator [Oscillospiraceae bacterium]